MTNVRRPKGRTVARRALRPLAILPILMAATAADAQSTVTVKPLSDQECTALAKEVSDKTGVSVDSVVGDASVYMFTNLDGTACLFSGTASGLSKNLDSLATIGDGYSGWTRDSAYDADGPGGTSVAFTRGTDWFALSVGAEPPSGSCEDVMVSECKVPFEKWTWTVSGMAFSTSSRSEKPSY